MSTEGIEPVQGRAKHLVAAALTALLVLASGAASWAGLAGAPALLETAAVLDAAEPAAWQMVQTGRSATPGAAVPKRGSSAMIEGGSSADRYGGSSADTEGVAGSQHRPGKSKPRPFGKSNRGDGSAQEKQYEKDRRLEDQEDRQERQRKAEEENARRPSGR